MNQDQTRQYIKYYCILENTRMLFRFIEELDRLLNVKSLQDGKPERERYNGEGGLAKRNTIIKDEFNCVKNKIAEAIKDREFLWQNTLSRYLRFWNEFYHRSDLDNYNIPWCPKKDLAKNDDVKCITRMLHLFRAVRFLSEMNASKLVDITDTFPYLYEDICLSVRDILGGKACGLLYQNEIGEVQTVAVGGHVYKKEASPQGYKFDEYYDFSNYKPFTINGSKEVKIEFEFDCYSTFSNATHRFKQFRFPRYSPKNTQDIFYLVIVSDKDDDMSQKEKNKARDEQEIYSITRILFLRDSLVEIISRDYATLLNFRYDYSYVRPLSNGNMKLIHMSDLHANEDTLWAQDGLLCEATYKSLEQHNGECEILSITGDIVNYSESAFDARKKYLNAQWYLTKLAIALWKTDDVDILDDSANSENIDWIIMPHDWKKRVIITTGNHDYLAVNELKAVSRDRKTKNAMPVDTTNYNALVKFTYFLQFLQDFLDAPIKELAKNDLNECRKYKYLKFYTLILNSNSLANSLQNNKVGFNSETIERLRKAYSDDIGDYKKVVFVHHGPFYTIDYLDDLYQGWKIRNWVKKINIDDEIYDIALSIQKVTKSYFKYIKTDIKQHSIGNLPQKGPLHNEVEEYFNKSEEMISGKLKRNPKILDKCKELDNYIHSTLHHDINKLFGLEKLFANEFYWQLMYNLKTIVTMENEDNENFKNLYQSIINNKYSVPERDEDGRYSLGEYALNVKVDDLDYPSNRYLVLYGHEHKGEYIDIASNDILGIMIGKGNVCYNIVKFDVKHKKLSFENIEIRTDVSA